MNYIRLQNKVQIHHEIVEKYQWDMFIYGGIQAYNSEERCRFLVDALTTNEQSAKVIGFYRTDKNSHREYKVQLENGSSKQGHFPEITEKLAAEIPQSAQRILIDLTSLELDALLYIFDIFHSRKNQSQLFASYLFPKAYDRSERGRYWLKTQQVPGFISLKPAFHRETTKHLVILGLDVGRSSHLIDCYDWDWNNVYPILGSPSYIENGAEKALRVNESWLSEGPYKNLIKLQADSPQAILNYLNQTVLNTHEDYLDIVSHGPKPLLLGVLHFYFNLSERNKGKVRLLHDYASSKYNSTRGIKAGYLYDCTNFFTR